MGAAIVSPIVREHDDASSNRHPPRLFCLSMALLENRDPAFGIMPWNRSILQWFVRQRKRPPPYLLGDKCDRIVPFCQSLEAKLSLGNAPHNQNYVSYSIIYGRVCDPARA